MSRIRNAAVPPVQTLRHVIVALSCLLFLLGYASAQSSASLTTLGVPNVVKFSGTIPATPAGTVGVIFALYTDQTGGAPLWQEVQNVSLDASGHYTSLLGSSTAAGIPLDVFSSNEARWLGVQVQGQSEQTRVLLVSVPYALKAADAQTLGGLPPSAFLRADAPAATAAYVNTAAVNAAVSRAGVAGLTPVDDTGWTAGYLPVFDASGNLQNSAVAQSGGNVGIGTATPLALLHLLSTNPTMRMENYGPAGSGDSPNFNFYSAEGTAAVPTQTLAGDNLGQFAAAGLPLGATSFGSSKVKVTFTATNSWTSSPLSEGTAMTFQTTAASDTSATRTNRMFIDNTGNVGIGSIYGVPANGGTAPPFPLSVSSSITSGAPIFVEATAPAGPVCTGSGCTSLIGVAAIMDATSGDTEGFSARLKSPDSVGLSLNFNVAPSDIIDANVGGNGSSPSAYFYVDGSGNITASGGLNLNFPTPPSGTMIFANSGSASFSVDSSANVGTTGGLIVNGPTNLAGGLSNGLVINGDVNVIGKLTKSSGTFKIDHPLDPANKFLYHSFVESPDMMNIYNGVVVLNKKGEAVVPLPDYFEALNQDFRYQLTSIGRFMPVFVAREIKGNKFTIAGGKPGAKVSWQVTGIRHDAYADAHRVVVEEDKGKERGTYLHPELFQNDPVVARK